MDDQPSVEALPNGGFVVAWMSDRRLLDGTRPVSGRVFDANGTPTSDEFLIYDGTTDTGFAPDVIAFDDNSFVVSWSAFGQDGAPDRIFHQQFDSDGTARTAALEINPGANYSFASDTRMGLLSNGNYVVGWSTISGTSFQIFDSQGAPVSAIQSPSNLLSPGGPRFVPLPDGGGSRRHIQKYRSGAQI